MSSRIPMDDPSWFFVGDIVTRDGTDRQLVISTNETPGYPPDGFTVRCIVAPVSGWCEVGDEEFNVTRRYDLVQRGGETIEGEFVEVYPPLRLT